VQKRAYVRRVINYYEELEKEYGLDVPSDRPRLDSVEHSAHFTAV